jgi:hypothetical protein
VIIVVGVLRSAPGTGGVDGAGGRSVSIARAAVQSGATVQLVGKIGDDPPGDLALLSLAADGIGHAAVLRDTTHPTARVPPSPDPVEPAMAVLDEATVESQAEGPAAAFDAQDLELALRYLSDFRVLVLADVLAEDARRVATDAASFSSAHIVAVIPTGAEPPAYEPMTALEAPESDSGDEFAALVGRYAAALDEGAAPEAAFRQATRGAGWEPAAQA